MSPDGVASPPPAVAAFVHRFSDPDELAAALRAGDVSYMPLPGRRYEAELSMLQIETLQLRRVRDDAHASHAAALPDRVTILVRAGPVGDTTVNGHVLEANTAFIAGPSGPLNGLCRGRQDWAALTLPQDDFPGLAEIWGDGPLHGTTRAFRLAQEAMDRTMAAVNAVADHIPFIMAGRASATELRGLRSSLQELVADIGAGVEEERKASRAVAGALRILRRCEAHLQENIERPVYLQDLCAVVGVSPRKLHQAFVAAVGMSPLAYLKRRRLGLVRRALRDGAAGARLVKSIALAHGFWHLGNFAHDYRAMFGEAPSETLARRRA